MYNSYAYFNIIIFRDFFSSIFLKDKDGVLSKEQCLRLSFRLFAVGKEGGIEMKDAKDLWSKFDIYETSEDHEMERQSEQVTFSLAIISFIHCVLD